MESRKESENSAEEIGEGKRQGGAWTVKKL